MCKINILTTGTISDFYRYIVLSINRKYSLHAFKFITNLHTSLINFCTIAAHWCNAVHAILDCGLVLPRIHDSSASVADLFFTRYLL